MGHTPLLKGQQTVAHRGDNDKDEKGVDPDLERIFAGAELFRLENTVGSVLSLQTLDSQREKEFLVSSKGQNWISGFEASRRHH